jgi:hypothetical protein
VENKLYKFPKKLDITKNASIDAACFFIDMEKCFGSETIINELEEDYSETDEEEYNKEFMKELATRDQNYNKKEAYQKNTSPEGFQNKFKSSYTNNIGKKRVIKPFTDLSKLKESKSKELQRVNCSPYTDSEKWIPKPTFSRGSNNFPKAKVPGSIKVLKKKKGVSSKEINSRGSKLPTSADSTHTSSIPTLPPVVRDSWFKDKMGRQNLESVKKRLQHKEGDFEDIYQDTDDNKSSLEPPYYSREAAYQKNPRNLEKRFKNVRKSYEGKNIYMNQIAKKLPKKKLQSAHVNSFKIIHRANSNLSSKSIENSQMKTSEQRPNFFSKRNGKYKDFHETKLKDILDKIESKKQYIKQIESKYKNDVGSPYQCDAKSKARIGSGVKMFPKSSTTSPTMSQYKKIKKSKERYQSRNENVITAVKVTPPPAASNNGLVFGKKRSSEQRQKRKQQIAPIAKKTKSKSKDPNHQRNWRYLNSWEQGGIAQAYDDIQEELSANDDSAIEKRTPREEGSAARRLIESMSKFACDNDDSDSVDDQFNDDFNEETSAQLKMLRSAQNNIGNMKYCRPYSPPFSQFSSNKEN